MRISLLPIDPNQRRILSLAEADAKQRLARLSPTELRIVKAVVEGSLNKNIANEFGRSQRTIENHRQRIYDKTELESVVDLLRLLLLAE